MKLVVGLGNIGKEYIGTRHNVGFMAIDKIADSLNVSFSKEKFGGLYVMFDYKNEKILFLKPQKYINLSGDVLKRFVDYFKVEVNDILIISDDLDMPIGKFKIKMKGSSGGHNGLKNIEANLHTSEYKRIKIGISNDKSLDTKDYVLGKFNNEDNNCINDVISLMPSIFDDYLNLSFDNLMNKYNKK